MAPKPSKGKDKAKGKESSSGPQEASASKQKSARMINVRHILCEKHAKHETALQHLQDGASFDEVARECSEDKARHGQSAFNDWDAEEDPPFSTESFASNYLMFPTVNPGGSLGWQERGQLIAAFEKVAYDLEPSSVKSPQYKTAKTEHGYHIIMVEGRK